MRGLCFFVFDLILCFDVLCNIELLSYREKRTCLLDVWLCRSNVNSFK